MSVSHLESLSLGAFAAAAVRHQFATLAEVVELLATVATANASALADQYGDNVEPADADDIEAVALDVLAGRVDAGTWPPLAYNCVTNAGRDYLPADVADRLRFIEQETRRHTDREERQQARAEANAAAYDDVPRLATMTADELRQAMADAGADRVIVARFRVDESESQSDYYNGRTAREVVIGLGRGRRESFAQLRKAAAGFKPTADYGPGLGRWFAHVVLDTDCMGNGFHHYAGERSGWHRDDAAGPLPTTAAAEAHAAAHPLQPLHVNGKTVPVSWRITEERIEHRETYSMGGGNYLGDARYSGWTVYSTTYATGAVEVHSLAAFGTKARK
jgi:hypothetical protein